VTAEEEQKEDSSSSSSIKGNHHNGYPIFRPRMRNNGELLK
jgi:hypothetical protein